MIHGGPGAAGQMAPLARELSPEFSLIEAIQSKLTITGLVDEIHKLIIKNCKWPVILVGHSWGAWLACLFANKYPIHVRKLILIGTPPFTEPEISITETRLNRLPENDREKAEYILVALNNPNTRPVSRGQMNELGKLLEKADTYAPIDSEPDNTDMDPDKFHGIWNEAVRLRSSGMLRSIVRSLTCPVTAIHGDFDLHPWKCVKDDLFKHNNISTFHLLPDCGHYPWKEKHAVHEFFLILRNELKTKE